MIVDKKNQYQTVSGRKVVIYAVYPDSDSRYQVHGALQDMEDLSTWECAIWTLAGKFHGDGSESSMDLVEINPNIYAHLHKDDLVRCIDSCGTVIRLGYFSHVTSDGKPACFSQGRTSRTAENELDVFVWSHVIKVED